MTEGYDGPHAQWRHALEEAFAADAGARFAAAEREVAAEGGHCAPDVPIYDFFKVDRPTGGGLPPFTAPRGAIRFLVPPSPWERPDQPFAGYHPAPVAALAHLAAAWSAVKDQRRRGTVVLRQTRQRGTDAWLVLTGRAEVEAPYVDWEAYERPEPPDPGWDDDDDDDDDRPYWDRP